MKNNSFHKFANLTQFLKKKCCLTQNQPSINPLFHRQIFLRKDLFSSLLKEKYEEQIGKNKEENKTFQRKICLWKRGLSVQ